MSRCRTAARLRAAWCAQCESSGARVVAPPRRWRCTRWSGVALRPCARRTRRSSYGRMSRRRSVPPAPTPPGSARRRSRSAPRSRRPVRARASPTSAPPPTRSAGSRRRARSRRSPRGLGVPPGEATGLARRIEVVVARDRSGARACNRARRHLAPRRRRRPRSWSRRPPGSRRRWRTARALSASGSPSRRGWIGVVRGRSSPSTRAGRARARRRRRGRRRRRPPSRRPPASTSSGSRCASRRAASLEPAPPDARRGHALAARISRASGATARGRVELLRLASGPGVRADAALEEGDEAPAGAVLATVIARRRRPRRGARAARAGAVRERRARARQPRPSARVAARAPRAPGGARGRRPAAGFLEALARRDEELVPQRTRRSRCVAAAIEAYDAELEVERARFIAEARRGRPRVGPSSGRSVELRHGGRRHRLEVRQTGPDAYRVAPGGRRRGRRAGRAPRRRGAPPRLARRRGAILVAVDGLRHLVRGGRGAARGPARSRRGSSPRRCRRWWWRSRSTPGQRVAAGEPVARIESMKVEMVVTAPYAGVVREVLTVANAQVDAGAPLVRIDPRRARPPPSPPPRRSRSAPRSRPEPADAARATSPRSHELQRLVARVRRERRGGEAGSARGWRELADAAPHDDAAMLRAEEQVVAAVRRRAVALHPRAPAEGDPSARPPLEELWRYLHEPEARGEGLAPAFVAALRRALSHYGLSLDEPGPRARDGAAPDAEGVRARGRAQLAPVLAILERRLAAEGVPPGGAPARAHCSTRSPRSARSGSPRSPTSLASSATGGFDQPALEEVRAEALRAGGGGSRAARRCRRARSARRSSSGSSSARSRSRRCSSRAWPRRRRALRPRLVETLLRRYYRARPLAPVVVAGASRASPAPSRTTRSAASGSGPSPCFARAGEIARRRARHLARLAAEAPEDRAARGRALPLARGRAAREGRAGRGAAGRARVGPRFTRPLRRVSVVIAFGGRGLGRQASQQHFTFRGDGELDARTGATAGSTRCSSAGCSSSGSRSSTSSGSPRRRTCTCTAASRAANPKDERLFAVAEVRDLTPVRDASGRVVQLPAARARAARGARGHAPVPGAAARRTSGSSGTGSSSRSTPPLPALARGDPRPRRAARARDAGARPRDGAHRRPDPRPGDGRAAETLLRIFAGDRGGVSIRWDEPTDRPLEPMAEYQQRVVQLRRRGLVHPFEIVRHARAGAAAAGGAAAARSWSTTSTPPARRSSRCSARPGRTRRTWWSASCASFTDRHPEGMRRVVLLGDPSRAMGSLAEPECRRIAAAIALAERLGVPLEWFAVSAGAKISMESGTENMDWISLVLRRIVEFTQRGGEINVVVSGHQRRRPAVLERRGDDAHAHPRHPRHDARLGDGAHREGGARVLRQRLRRGQPGHRRVRPDHGAERPGAVPRRERRRGDPRSSCATTSTRTSRPGERFPRRARDRAIPRTATCGLVPHGPDGRRRLRDGRRRVQRREEPGSQEAVRHPPRDGRVRRPGPRAARALARPARRRHRGRLGRAPGRLPGVPPRHRVAPAAAARVRARGRARSSGRPGTLFPQSSKKIARALNVGERQPAGGGAREPLRASTARPSRCAGCSSSTAPRSAGRW